MPAPRSLLSVLIPALFAAHSVPALAQTPTEGQPAGTMAEQAQNLPDVVVTDEKTRRSRFKTATSTEVAKAAEIAKHAGTRSSHDILAHTANVVDLGNDNNLPTVRGVDGSGPATGAVAFLAGTRPRLNFSIDGRSATYNEAAFGTQSLWDVKQVEILRGPQSLTRGRNAVAGSVVVETNDPSDKWEGAVKLAAGNQKSRQAAVMLSGPIVADNLSFRLSVDRQERESHIPLTHYSPVGNPRRVETTTARAKLLYAPASNPNFYTKLTLNHTQSRTPQSETKDNPGSPRYAPERPVFKTDSTSGMWDISWQLAPNWRVENKLVYTKYGNDRLSLPAPRGVPATLDGKEWQLEPVLRYRSDSGSLKALAGVYLFHAEQDETVDLANRARRVFHNVFKDKTDNRALFAEAEWAFAPQWSATFGARWEQEHHRRTGGTDLFRINRNQKQNVFLPKAEIAWQPNERFNTGIRIARGYNSGGAGVTFGVPYTAYEYKPEYVWNYEWFGRYKLPEHGLELSSNVFFNNYKDMQLPFYLGANSVVIRNAAKVQTYGAEFGANWKPTENLTLNGSLGLLHTEVKRFSNSGTEGKQLSRSPKYTAAISASYLLPRGFEIGGKVRFSGGYYSNAQNTEVGRIKAYSQTDLYAAYNFKHGRISLYADNVLNSRRDIFIPAADRREALAQRPRAVGIAAEMKF